jgi:orotidine-5'-phosphate decarboxylase
MDIRALEEQIRQKESLLCVGLDSAKDRIPQEFLKMALPQYEFNKRIIDATEKYAVAYKPNTAFYEAAGVEGWLSLEYTQKYIKEKYPHIFTIADAKRGDIGNTSKQYAEAFFGRMDFDAITLIPYMGYDVIAPFLEYEGKYVILLALTSNKAADEIQMIDCNGGLKLFEHIISKAVNWGVEDRLMFVVGATKPQYFKQIRKLVPNHFLLVPGIGAQGGSIKDVINYGKSPNYGLLINSSRGIIFAGSGFNDFDKAAADAAKSAVRDMRNAGL